MLLRRRRTALAAVALAASALAACSGPETADPDQGQASEDPLGAQAPDPGEQALANEVNELSALLDDVAERLGAAADAQTASAARGEAEAAIELLVGAPADGQEPLFPVDRGARGSSSERADRLTGTLTVAREAGDAGREVRELLRDLVAGELGAWQRDADGMVARVEEAATPAGSLSETEEQVLALPGEVTRALAWAMLARDAGDADRAGEYAARGVSHLEVSLQGLADLDLAGGGS